MHNYKNLIVWQKAREVVRDIYLLSEKFPKSESFGLIQQLRRAAISISSNIAEGAGRSTSIDFCRFIDIANGSAFEAESQLLLAFDLNYISESELDEAVSKMKDVQRLLFKFEQNLQEKS
jgi:four helix bundle protein